MGALTLKKPVNIKPPKAGDKIYSPLGFDINILFIDHKSCYFEAKLQDSANPDRCIRGEYTAEEFPQGIDIIRRGKKVRAPWPEEEE